MERVFSVSNNFQFSLCHLLQDDIFQIGTFSGKVTILKELDYESKQRYELLVFVTVSLKMTIHNFNLIYYIKSVYVIPEHFLFLENIVCSSKVTILCFFKQLLYYFVYYMLWDIKMFWNCIFFSSLKGWRIHLECNHRYYSENVDDEGPVFSKSTYNITIMEGTYNEVDIPLPPLKLCLLLFSTERLPSSLLIVNVILNIML